MKKHTQIYKSSFLKSSTWQQVLLFCFCTLLFAACSSKDEADNFDEAKQRETDEAFIQDYLKRNNITTAKRTASGLYYVVKTDSTVTPGERAVAGRTVDVHYIGRLAGNGSKFDSSYDRSRPFSFLLGAGRVIKGWDEGVALMRENETYDLIIPSHLAYGRNGNGSIPPNAVLVFDVTLLQVK